ncbi:cupin domain-containing protein [Halobellus captivus]|uniref:cupin domain-containing protein n=1 Tax=Halobellus captivus TaxID=2592614 RepID=UPI0011A4760C|nr:cupin domain-containing protein [Halobellus captivus]
MSRVNERELEWTEVKRERTNFKRKKLASAADFDDIGASLYELPPDASSWPYHFHTGNAEAMYVLSGTGALRTPDGESRIEAGDFCGFPADPDGAHRLHNDGDEPLRYLAVSTMRDPDVTVYPDSEKIGVYAGSPPGSDDERVVSGYFRRGDDVDYWEDES